MIAAGLRKEVSFLSGFERNRTLAQQAFSTWNGDRPPTYSDQSHQFKWGGGRAGTPGGVVTYAFAQAAHWTAAERKVFVAGLQLWSDEANIRFQRAAAGQSADLTFRRNESGNSFENETEPTHLVGTRVVSNPTNCVVNIDTRAKFFGPIDKPFSFQAFPLSTVVHEEGHVLGLGHTGPYNGGKAVKSDAAQLGPYDSQLYSVMSYIYPADRRAKFSAEYPVHARFPNAETPMIADILAAQRLYGEPTHTALSGGQVFGFNCNITDASRLFYDFDINKHPAVTLFDTGLCNTLDLSGFAEPSTVNMSPGTFSSIDGRINNIAIAYDTSISKVVCGSGGDTVTGAVGNDTIVSGPGDDTLTGNAGQDVFVFKPSSGNDVVTDFNVAGCSRDMLLFSQAQFLCLGDLMHHTTMDNGSAVIHVDVADTVTLQNVSKQDLRAHKHDFHLT